MSKDGSWERELNRKFAEMDRVLNQGIRRLGMTETLPRGSGARRPPQPPPARIEGRKVRIKQSASLPWPPQPSGDLSYLAKDHTRDQEFIDRVRQSREDLNKLKKEDLKNGLWFLYGGIMGGLAIGIVIAGTARGNITLVVGGLLFGLLAWRGRAFVEWCEAREKASKAGREAPVAEPAKEPDVAGPKV